MRAFIYLRQSLDRTGEGAAVERQRQDCRKLCVERGWEIVHEYADNDTSASSGKPRPQYQAMLAAVERGEAEVIVAWHPDRLARRVIDLEGIVELANRTGIRIASVTGDLDLSNDMGRGVARILASIAQMEVERKGARQKRAQQQAADEGRPAGGRRAFGYEKDGLTVRESEAKLVRAAYRSLLEGASLKSIARGWNEASVMSTAGNPWNHSSVRRALQNPRYAGLRTYRGKVVGPATWPALVDVETLEAAQALLSLPERRTTSDTARKHLLPAIALCGACGSDMATGHTRHGKRVYVCRAGKHISRKAQPVDELVEAVVVERLSRPDAVELLSKRDSPDVSAYRSKAEAIKDRLDDLAIGLEEGALTLNAVRRSSERLRSELGTLEGKIQDATHVDVLRPLVTAADVAATWATCDLKQKRAVIDTLMTVTLFSPKMGRQEFDPETVSIDWKGAP